MKKNCLIFAISIMVLSCSPEKEYIEKGKMFFKSLDEGKYDLAYDLISDEDKQCLSKERFSLEIEKLKTNVRYTAKQDSTLTFFLKAIEDSTITKLKQNDIVLPIGSKSPYLFYEISRVPDIQTMMNSIENYNYNKKSEINRRLSNGDFPSKLDSNRYCIVVQENDKAKIYLGSKYWLTRDSLISEYQSLLKKSVSIRSTGLGHIYRTVSHSVVGRIPFELENLSKDTLSCISIRVIGQFKQISTDMEYLTLDSDLLNLDVLPHSKVNGSVVFLDSFLSNILGYLNDETFVSANIEIVEFPKYGAGPDYDAIIMSKTWAPLYIFASPIKIGINDLRY